jgi:hypothetical protein
MDIDVLPVVVSYGVVFSIATAIFVYCEDKKKNEINNLTRKWKKCRNKLQQTIKEINNSEGVMTLRKSVEKVRAILSPYYGYAPIALDGSAIDSIIIELSNESDNAKLESLRLKAVQTVDRVSKGAWECSKREINGNSLIKNIITIIMLDFFFFTTWYVMKNYSLYLLRERGIEDVPTFSDIITYLWICAITANVSFVFILGRNYKYCKKP